MTRRPPPLVVLVLTVPLVAALAAVPFAAGAPAETSQPAGTAVGTGPSAGTPVGAAPLVPDGAASSGVLHGNHVVVGPQVSPDGTVVAEEAATLAPGWLVIRRDDGGQPGEPLGHTYLNGSAFRTDVSAAIDDGTWADWSGGRTLWAVVHFDDGDGQFDLATDPSAADRYPAAARQFTLERGDRPVRLLARQFDPLPAAEGSITVRRVALAEDGYVVAHPVDGDRVLGTQALSAGRHENVSLALDPGFLADRDDRFRVRLVAYRDDGDGEFDDDDSPVQVGGDPVDTDVVVRRVGGNVTTTEPLVITPTPSETDLDPGRGTDAGATATATTAPSDASVDTDASGPGFGVAPALVAVLLVVAAVRSSVLKN